MRKRTLMNQVGQLVSEHAPDDVPAFGQATIDANRKASRLTWMVAAGFLVVAAITLVVVFLVTMGDDLAEYGDETLPIAIMGYAFMSPLPVALLVVGLVMTNRRAFAYGLSQIMTEQGMLDRVPQARQVFRTRPFKTLYQATWVVATVVLIAFGAVWAAVISAVTASALATAKDPKAM